MGGGPQYAAGPPYGQAPAQPHQQAGYTAPTSQQVSPTHSPLFRFIVADPGSGAFLTAASGMGKKSGSGSGMYNSDHIFYSLKTIFWC